MVDAKLDDLTAANPLDGTERVYIVQDITGTPHDRRTTTQDIADLATGGGGSGYAVTQVADTTFYVDPSGNDANDGSIANPWLTLQHAADYMGKVNANGFATGIQINDGTYSAGGGVDVMAVMFRPFNCKYFSIIGNTTTPGNVVLDGVDQTANGICLGFRDDVFALTSGVIVDEIAGFRWKNVTRGCFGANFSNNIFMHDVESEDVIVDFWTESWAGLYVENPKLYGTRANIAKTKNFSNAYIFGLIGDVGADFTAEGFLVYDTSITIVDGPDYTDIAGSGGATQWVVDAFCKLNTGGVTVPGAAGSTDALGLVI